MKQLAEQAATQALLELSARSFGTVNTVTLEELALQEQEGEPYWLLNFAVTSVGLEQPVKMVLLPEFLELDSTPELTDTEHEEWLIGQIAAFIVDRILNDA